MDRSEADPAMIGTVLEIGLGALTAIIALAGLAALGAVGTRRGRAVKPRGREHPGRSVRTPSPSARPTP